jgi:hypothetical protein
MKEIIKTVFLNYAFCSVIGGFVEYLTPEKMKKTIRVCTVLVILAMCFAPFVGTELDFTAPDITGIDLEQNKYNALMHTASLMEKEVYAGIKQTLINLNIDEYEIYVSTEIDAECNTVYFKEIKVEVDEQYEALLPQIKSTVEQEYVDILKVGVKNERAF